MTELKTYYQLLNNYFDHIYVITLKRAIERHKKIKKNLDGLNYEFLFGADNKEFSVEELINAGIYDEQKAKAVHRYHKTFNAGMLGCTISHKMVYEDVIEKGYQKVLIFEDDIVPNEEGVKLFPVILEELPADWGLLYFDYNKNIKRTAGKFIKQQFYHVQKILGALNLSHATISNLYAKPFSKHLMVAGHHDFGSAYCITNETAKKLVRLQTPVAFWSDHLLAYVCSNKIVRGYLSVPKLFVQESQFNKEVVGSYAEES